MSPHNSLDKVFWYLGQTIGTLFIVIALYDMYLRISELADTPNWSPMMALKRYRKYLGLTGLPSPAESDPLILKQKGRGGVFSTRQLRDIVQRYFNSTVRRLREEGFTDDAGALQCIGCDTKGFRTM